METPGWIRQWLESPARYGFETVKKIGTLEYIEGLEADACHVCKWNDAEKIVCKAPIPYCEEVAEWRGVQEECN